MSSTQSLYRLFGVLLGLVLRPHWNRAFRAAHAPFILGPSAWAAPSVWQFLLAGGEYRPRLDELRCGAGRRSRLSLQEFLASNTREPAAASRLLART